MEKYSRRGFLKQLGAFAALALGGRSALSAAKIDTEAFNFLVVGDSLISGQGLREEQKFYHLTKEWLQREVFKNERQVNLNVKAHSGASLNLPPLESKALQVAEIGEDEFFHREVNLLFPSIRTQIDVARKEYENPQSVNLIMLTGGITDIHLSTILNPFRDNNELKTNIVKHCNQKMFELLEHAAGEFPNALIAVVGYYPFLSKYTPASRIFSNVMAIYDVPQPLKAMINTRLNRRILKRYRNKMVERSLIWAQDSTLEFKKAVGRVNEKFGTQRAVFIESPITEENCMGTKNPLLYEIKNGKAQDALAAERKSVCKPTLERLRKSTKLELRTRTCELATIGHPNVEGSKRYADAIKGKLLPLFTK